MFGGDRQNDLMERIQDDEQNSLTFHNVHLQAYGGGDQVYLEARQLESSTTKGAADTLEFGSGRDQPGRHAPEFLKKK